MSRFDPPCTYLYQMDHNMSLQIVFLALDLLVHIYTTKFGSSLHSWKVSSFCIVSMVSAWHHFRFEISLLCFIYFVTCQFHKKHTLSMSLDIQSHRNWEDVKTLPTTPGPDSEEVPKKEVLNLIRLFWRWGFPYISLNYIMQLIYRSGEDSSIWMFAWNFWCQAHTKPGHREEKWDFPVIFGDLVAHMSPVWWKDKGLKKWRSTVYSPEN